MISRPTVSPKRPQIAPGQALKSLPEHPRPDGTRAALPSVRERPDLRARWRLTSGQDPRRHRKRASHPCNLAKRSRPRSYIEDVWQRRSTVAKSAKPPRASPSCVSPAITVAEIGRSRRRVSVSLDSVPRSSSRWADGSLAYISADQHKRIETRSPDVL